ncbi:MAG: methionyl-tRNA formyltransferase [Actinobacteria bacterium]|nr:methionyl-tRNA formyltransferase [Actinomycetota bacterium]
MRLAFFGTPDFATSFLYALITSHHEVELVVSSPDKPAGRGRKLQSPNVIIFAKERNLNLIQPEDISSKEFLDSLKEMALDACIVVSYGKIIKKELLVLPKHGFINVHPSLLPKYRGSTPIESAIMAGERRSGVTIMKMNEKVDAGDIVLQQEFDIDPDDNYADVLNKIIDIGPNLLLQALRMIQNGTMKYTPQDEAIATYTKKIEKNDLQIDWHQKAGMIHNKVRSVHPIRSCYTYLNKIRIEITKTKPTDHLSTSPPGIIVGIDKEDIIVATRDYNLRILRLKPENKKEMPAAAFARGVRDVSGLVLGH